MKKEKPIVHYTAEQIDALLMQGESQTDWKRIQGMSAEDIERNADEDPESPSYPYDADFWHDAELSSPKQKISIRLDSRIIDYFKRKGSGYQKRINAVLDAYVRQQLRHEHQSKRDQ